MCNAERRTVSLHEVKVWLALRGKPGQWLTNDEIAKESGVRVRTARQYTLRLVKQGLLERAETFPAYRFRLASKVEPSAYQQRIEAVIEAFGLQADAMGGPMVPARLDTARLDLA
jgi:predicted transcriptional regulator of viral defense system